MVDKSTDYGNEVIVAQFHFLFSCSRFSAKVQRKWTSKTPNIIVEKEIENNFHGLYSYRP